jgi:hypothetical protein
MSKIIKKQLRRSLPIFMIFSLLVSTTVAGLVFNLDVSLVSTVNKLSLELGWSEAKAADVASTTVTVRNAPPNLVGNVAEAPASAPTTPVNVGANAVWQATANDPESNNYFLIVCASDAVSPHNGAAPTCGGGAGDTFCVSGSTLTGNQATCIDDSLADPGAESDIWYSYVCDDHGTEAECSAVNQGSGDSGSPIYINHAPGFTAVITSDDNKGPGGTFTVTASTTDADIEGGADEIYLTVCSTNSWATSTGCTAATWCTGSAVATDVSCSFATSTPAVDNTYTYYAFVRDWHEMPTAVNGRNAPYTVINVAPSVSNVVINGGVTITTNMKGQTDYVASTTADLYDANSCLDITGSATPATSSIYLSTVAGGLNCSADPNSCYQITTANCSYIAGSCTGSSDTTASYICTASITHYASPTDATTNNPNEGADWRGGMTATDDNGLQASAASVGGVELESLQALAVSETQIPYGTIRGGQNSGAANATTTVINYGNVPIDTQIAGTDMDKSDLTDSIPANNQIYGLANFTYPAAPYTLTTAIPGDLIDVEIAKPTSATDVSDQLFWGINIPGGTSSGNYSGMNTFTATLDPADW